MLRRKKRGGRDAPPHRQPDEAFHEQRDSLRATLSSIGDAVITTDNNGGVTFLNPVAQSFTGWTQEETAGVSLESVFRVINETGRTVENPAARALRQGLVVGLADGTLLISRNGRKRPIEGNAAPIRNARDEVAGVVLVFRDVSERTGKELAAQDALAYAENIIATLHDPFLVLDKELRVVTANGSFYRTFQVTPEETQGSFLYDLGSHQWDIPRLRTLLEEVLPKNHAFQDYEVEHDFQALGRKIMVLNARRIGKPEAPSELILLGIEDITARKEGEEALRVSEVQYRRLFESAKDGILILDARTGRITDANPFMTHLLGYSHADFLEKEMWEIGLFKDRSGSEAAVRELQANGYIRYAHLPLETADGRLVDVEVVANTYQQDHRPVIQCNIRDITERRRLERETLEQAATLSDLHRRKDEFLAMLSHELRNPLAPIANAVHLLRLNQRSENEIERQARAIIERQVGQLKHLVDDLLEVSRITTGRVRLRRERVTVSGIVDGAVETAHPLIKHRRHELTVSQPQQPIWLHADAARLEQVVVNLLTNAAKYSEEGGHIWLTVEQEGETAVLRVRDEGVGIAPGLLPRIFELFTQAERTLDRSEGGFGIGLSLVQRLVELHGGTVRVISVLGQGSEFVVRLPMMTTAALPSSPSVEPARSTKSLRVLVVDDNVDSTESLAMLLRAAGHEVRTTHDGPVTLEAALAYRPDVVLLDIGLPGLDGFEVAKRIRQQPMLQDLVLVAMTGYGQETDRRRSQEAGFDHHLVKPADFDEVLKILESVSGKAK